MLISFEELSPNAKIWVFKGERHLENQEVEKLENTLEKFIAQWLSHGANVKGGFFFYENQFLVVGAETPEGDPSGCSTDTLIHFLVELSQASGINFMDNSSFFFQEAGKFEKVGFLEITNQIKSGKISPKSLFLNNQVTRKADFEKNILVSGEELLGPKYFSSVKG